MKKKTVTQLNREIRKQMRRALMDPNERGARRRLLRIQGGHQVAAPRTGWAR